MNKKEIIEYLEEEIKKGKKRRIKVDILMIIISLFFFAMCFFSFSWMILAKKYTQSIIVAFFLPFIIMTISILAILCILIIYETPKTCLKIDRYYDEKHKYEDAYRRDCYGKRKHIFDLYSHTLDKYYEKCNRKVKVALLKKLLNQNYIMTDNKIEKKDIEIFKENVYEWIESTPKFASRDNKFTFAEIKLLKKDRTGRNEYSCEIFNGMYIELPKKMLAYKELDCNALKLSQKSKKMIYTLKSQLKAKDIIIRSQDNKLKIMIEEFNLLDDIRINTKKSASEIYNSKIAGFEIKLRFLEKCVEIFENLEFEESENLEMYEELNELDKRNFIIKFVERFRKKYVIRNILYNLLIILFFSLSAIFLQVNSEFIDIVTDSKSILANIFLFVFLSAGIYIKLISEINFSRYSQKASQKLKVELFKTLLKIQPQKYILKKEGLTQREIKGLKNDSLVNTFDYNKIKSQNKLVISNNKDIIISELKLEKNKKNGIDTESTVFNGLYINFRLENSINNKVYIKNIYVPYMENKKETYNVVHCKNLNELIEKTFDEYFSVLHSVETQDNYAHILSFDTKLKLLELLKKFHESMCFADFSMCIDNDRLTILLKWKILEDFDLNFEIDGKYILSDFQEHMDFVKYIVENFKKFEL